MTRRPAVSVLIPAYNRPQELLRAVESVLNQTFNDFELIVVDDGSETDLTLVRARVETSGGQFVTIPHGGVARARNEGLRRARGEWIALLDSDDLWLPKKLEKQMRYLAATPNLRILQSEEIWYRNGVRVNPKKAHLMPEGDAFERSLKACCISSSSVLLHTSLFEQVGNYDERLVVCEDYDLWLRITSKYPIGLLRENLALKFGGHADQLSRAYPAMDRFRVFSMLKLLLTFPLSTNQLQALFKELSAKCSVLAQASTKYPTSDMVLQLASGSLHLDVQVSPI